MDLDDLLEDLWEDAVKGARQQSHQLRRRARLPEFRRRMRSAALWGSTAWVSVFGGGAIATELAVDGGVGTAVAVALGLVAAPAVPTGVWAWRTRSRDRSAAREAEAKRRAKAERDDLPADVVDDWMRLRKAQVLVEDLAQQGLVDVGAVGEQQAMVDELRTLLTADRRATELGGSPSQPLRRQVGDLADLLVALAAEAVEHRTEEVERFGTPATLRDARERLVALRAARTELASVEDDAARASAFIDRERESRGAVDTQRPGWPGQPATGDRGTQAGPGDDETPGAPRATPG